MKAEHLVPISQLLDKSSPVNRTAKRGDDVFQALNALSQVEKLRDKAKELLRGNPVLHPSCALRKTPPRALAGSWHQDFLPPGAQETVLLNVWLPLTSTDPERGSLLVWPRSHKAGKLPHNFLLKEIPEEELPAKGAPLSFSLHPGDVLLFHHMLVHASGANSSHRSIWSADFRYAVSRST